MTKTIIITSKKNYLNDTIDNIMLGAYEYIPASYAVTGCISAVIQFNSGRDSKQIVNLVVKEVDREFADIKIKGKKDSIYSFLNRVIAETDILEKFNIKF